MEKTVFSKIKDELATTILDCEDVLRSKHISKGQRLYHQGKRDQAEEILTRIYEQQMSSPRSSSTILLVSALEAQLEVSRNFAKERKETDVGDYWFHMGIIWLAERILEDR